MLLARSLAFLIVFYVNTALFLVLGSWLLLSPRRWAMEGLRLHGLSSLWWLKMICGTRVEVRGREKFLTAHASSPPNISLPGTRSASFPYFAIRPW